VAAFGQSDLKQLTEVVSKLGADVSQIGADVSKLGADVSKLGADVQQLKKDVQELKQDVKQIEQNGQRFQQDLEVKARTSSVYMHAHIVLRCVIVASSCSNTVAVASNCGASQRSCNNIAVGTP
jgi:uncharacterized protein (DUF3084 family)